MMYSSSATVCLFLLLQINLFFVKSEVLRTEDGEIEGSIMQTRQGENFHAFLKIPFAEPPVGNLRFKAPMPKSPWTGVIDCTKYGPMCMQPNTWNNFEVSEDCLHLNVFTKTLPVNNAAIELKPVIVYIHGGSFETGSAIEHGPEYLMERDIILVTVNYRLGVFGFMALETVEIPGNAGLKDQSLALKWVQKNIKHFGGDPDMVTITGLSAGGYSVTGHMVSPMSQGLFKNVIAMSGALAWQKSLKTNNIDEVKQLAARLNCPGQSVGEVLEYLEKESAEAIAEHEIFSFLSCAVMTWLPVIEKQLGQESFLIEDPNVSFREGRFHNVSVIIGITADEFISPVALIIDNKTLSNFVNENFDEIAPKCFFFDENGSKSIAEIGKALRKFYLPFDVIDGRSFSSLNQLVSDGVIGYGVHRFVHYVSPKIPVFYYKLSYVGRFSLFNYPGNSPYGVHHADDIQYVFNAGYVGPMITVNDPENVLVERMTRIWANFAKTGNPNNDSDPYLQSMNWPRHDLENEYFLDIGNNLIEKRGLYLERYTVWDNLDKSSAIHIFSSISMALITSISFLWRILNN